MSDITKKDGVCGGVACIRNTRIPVWILVKFKKLSIPDHRLLDYYPVLKQTDLDAAWNYYKYNTEEINNNIKHQNTE